MASAGALALICLVADFGGTARATYAEVDDVTATAQVLADPSSFNLELVTLVGTIRDIRTFVDHAECGTGTGYVFYLRDETAELTIRHLGTCQDGAYVPADPIPVVRGDRVHVRAVIVEHPEALADESPLEATLVRLDHLSE